MALLRCRACLHSAFAAAFFFFAFSSAAAGSDNSARRHFLAGRFMFCVAQSGTGQTLDCSASGVSPSAARAAGKSKFCPHFFRHRLFLCSRGFKRPASRILPKAAAELASKYEKCTDYSKRPLWRASIFPRALTTICVETKSRRAPVPVRPPSAAGNRVTFSVYLSPLYAYLLSVYA